MDAGDSARDAISAVETVDLAWDIAGLGLTLCVGGSSDLLLDVFNMDLENGTQDPLRDAIIKIINTFPGKFIQMEAQVYIMVTIKWQECVKKPCCRNDYKSWYEKRKMTHQCRSKYKGYTHGDTKEGFPIDKPVEILQAVPGCVNEAISTMVWNGK